jgi:hypothetical protein
MVFPEQMYTIREEYILDAVLFETIFLKCDVGTTDSSSVILNIVGSRTVPFEHGRFVQ